jgi:ParB family transcriptional regulator, chromosome partitioning protein
MLSPPVRSFDESEFARVEQPRKRGLLVTSDAMAHTRRMAAAKRKTPKAKSQKKRPRGKLAPARERRGLAATEVALPLDQPDVAELAAQIVAAGGAALGAYRDPLGGRPIVLASLPLAALQPTPFQRDLSPTHTKRLAAKIDEAGAFLDPLIVVRGPDGALWTPNGRHRLAAAKVLGLRQITALVSPDDSLAYRILALNTEKAHNLKDKSLEVIRMARSLAKANRDKRESEFAAEFEAPELLTLGIIYEDDSRFAGGAYSPFLKKVDRFADKALPTTLRDREAWAARLLEIDSDVKSIVAKLQAQGLRSPYLRNYVVARINPVRFHKAKKGDTTPPMMMPQALLRMSAAAKKFDTKKVSSADLAWVAAGAESAD